LVAAVVIAVGSAALIVGLADELRIVGYRLFVLTDLPVSPAARVISHHILAAGNDLAQVIYHLRVILELQIDHGALTEISEIVRTETYELTVIFQRLRVVAQLGISSRPQFVGFNRIRLAFDRLSEEVDCLLVLLVTQQVAAPLNVLGSRICYG